MTPPVLLDIYRWRMGYRADVRENCPETGTAILVPPNRIGTHELDL
jgi:hypothetical protein